MEEKTEQINNIETTNNLLSDICFGDKIQLKNNHVGIIEYIGRPTFHKHISTDIWYGITLNLAKGEHNGTVRGIKYWECKEKHGTFIKKTDIKQIITKKKGDRFTINTVIQINKKDSNNYKKNGVIRFIGFISELKDKHVSYGIETLDDIGDNNGDYNGNYYFVCPMSHGMFLKETELIYLDKNIPINKNYTSKSLYKHQKTMSKALNLVGLNLDKIDINDDDNKNIDNKISPLLDTDTDIDSDDDEEDDDIFLTMEEIETKFRTPDNETKRMSFARILTDFKETQKEEKETVRILSKKFVGAAAFTKNAAVVLPHQKVYSYAQEAQDLVRKRKDTTEDEFSIVAMGQNEKKSFEKIRAPGRKGKRKRGMSNKKNYSIKIDEDNTDIDNNKKSNNNNKDKDVNNNDKTDKNDEKENTEETSITSIPPKLALQYTLSVKSDEDEPEYEPSLKSPTSQDVYSWIFKEKIKNEKKDDDSKEDNDANNNVDGKKCILKPEPQQPWDIRSTLQEFENISDSIMLGCNNPKAIFKVLKGICQNLKLADPKYRLINPNHVTVKNRLLRYEGTEEFLFLLGFEKLENENGILKCSSDQPPLSVINDGITCCDLMLRRCNQKRAALDMIKNLANNNKLKRKSKKVKKKINRKSSVEPLNETPISATPLTMTRFSSIGSVSQSKGEQMVADIEGENDRFQLHELIWGVTHENNKDHELETILLLTFVTFTDGVTLFKTLEDRYFENSDTNSNIEDSVSRQSNDTLHSLSIIENQKPNILRVESSFVVQSKVVNFIQRWMRAYWEEDFSDDDALVKMVEDFIEKSKEALKNDTELAKDEYKKSRNLIEMVEKTMTKQENEYELKIKLELLNENKAKKFKNMLGMESTIKEKRFNFIKMDNYEIAKNITLMEFELFAKIQKRECLSQRWKKKNKQDLAPNILDIITHFNNISKWVQANILLAPNVKKRGRLIKKFIKIADELLSMRNFQSLGAFHGALTSAPIFKLKHAWTFVPAKHILKFEEIKIIFQTTNSMSNLKKLIREANPPMIPYIGIFLSELVSIDEGNKNRKNDGTINFSKLMRLNNQINSILIHQQNKYTNIKEFRNYKEEIKQLLIADFNINSKLSQDDIWKISKDVAKRDLPKKKSFLISNKKPISPRSPKSPKSPTKTTRSRFKSFGSGLLSPKSRK